MFDWLKKLFLKDELTCPFYDAVFGECDNATKMNVSVKLRTKSIHCIENIDCHYRRWKKGQAK